MDILAFRSWSLSILHHGDSPSYDMIRQPCSHCPVPHSGLFCSLQLQLHAKAISSFTKITAKMPMRACQDIRLSSLAHIETRQHLSTPQKKVKNLTCKAKPSRARRPSVSHPNGASSSGQAALVVAVGSLILASTLLLPRTATTFPLHGRGFVASGWSGCSTTLKILIQSKHYIAKSEITVAGNVGMQVH